MIITGRQIRGARGLLGWGMEDLANKTGLTRITIRQIEADTVQPQERTMAKIFSVFDKYGIEFQPDEGIKMRKQETRCYSGKAGFRQFLEHVHETLKNGGVIRQFNFGDLRYMPSEESFVAEHIGRMATIKGLDAKVLEQAGATTRPVSYCSYRALDKQFKEMVPWYLYGDYVALSLNEAGGKKDFITIRSKLLAERYIKEFDIFWSLSAPSRRKKAK